MTAPTFQPPGTTQEVENGSTFMPRFNADGLITAIVQDHATRAILMVAYMNAEALHLTLTTGTAHFWTRSRQRLWKKGEDSGNTLTVLDMQTDCDQDVLLVQVKVEGAGVACHTGMPSCFYRNVSLSAPHGLRRR